MDLLWREALGAFLRLMRTEQQRILTDIAAQAGVSPQYLSEIERGRKEPSSEILAAVGGALGLTLLQITRGVAQKFAPPAAVRSSCNRIERRQAERILEARARTRSTSSAWMIRSGMVPLPSIAGWCNTTRPCRRMPRWPAVPPANNTAAAPTAWPTHVVATSQLMKRMVS